MTPSTDTRVSALCDALEEARRALKPFEHCSTGSPAEVPGDTSVQASTLYYHMSAEHIAALAERGITIPDNRVSLIVSFDGLKIADFRGAKDALATIDAALTKARAAS